jgi:two-component system chemotaxis sensor kinase CheA
MPIFDFKSLLPTFLEEATEHLVVMEEGLLKLETNAADRELVDSIFRSAHSIKGGSATLSLTEMTRLTHALETALDGVRRGELEVTSERVNAFLRANDALRILLDATRTGTKATLDIDPLIQLLETVGRCEAAAKPSAPAPPVKMIYDYQVVFVPKPELFAKGIDPLLLLRDLVNAGSLIASEAHLDRLPPLAELDPGRCHLGWTVCVRSASTSDELRDLFVFVQDDCRLEITAMAAYFPDDELVAPAPPAEPAPAPTADEPPSSAGPVMFNRRADDRRDASSIRVPTEKLDRLVDLVGELVIAQSMIGEAATDFTPAKLGRLKQAMAEMERNTRELQERVMSIRMVPMASVFSRFGRIVRDLSASLGKSAAVVIEGAETELDKSVIERIGDPLVHLVRNAVDHGLESPEARRAAGKPEQGTVRLNASHRGGKVVIDVSDDGRGLDAERLLAKARKQGLVGENQVLARDDIHNLIFKPGFSTAEVVSDVSGRGVGMDVVRRSIDALNGTIQIQTQPGQGTRFQIMLPLTLAILDGLCVGVRGETYVIPLVSIVESLRTKREEVHAVAGRNEVMVVRGQAIPLVRLDRLFGLERPAPETPWELTVIIENEGKKIALPVDEIQGQSQVVIKSLEANYRRIEGLMGATILGDGRVALILDLPALARLAQPALRGEGPMDAEREVRA